MMPKWTKGTDALDRPRVRLTAQGTTERRTGKDSGRAPLEDTGRYLRKGDQRYPLALFDDVAAAWAEVSAAVQVKAAQRPWERHIEKGKAYLVRWQPRVAHAARLLTAPPKFLPVVGERVGPILPASRWRELQAVLDEHDPGRRLAAVPVVRSPRGRRHPPRMTEWDRYCYRISAAQIRPRHGFTSAEIEELAALRGQWRNARKCARPECFQFLRRADRRKYCSPACKQAAKKSRGDSG